MTAKKRIRWLNRLRHLFDHRVLLPSLRSNSSAASAGGLFFSCCSFSYLKQHFSVGEYLQTISHFGSASLHIEHSVHRMTFSPAAKTVNQDPQQQRVRLTRVTENPMNPTEPITQTSLPACR